MAAAIRVKNLLSGLIGTAAPPVYAVNTASTEKAIPEEDYAAIQNKPTLTFDLKTVGPHHFIPQWHGFTAYSPSFTGNAVDKLQLASCQDLARYLKVIGFKKAHVTKEDAAKLIVVGILAAKRNNEFNTDPSTAIMCGGMTDRWYNRMPGTPCEDTKLLKEILCGMEMAYTKLKEGMDKYYDAMEAANAATWPKSAKPVYGLTLNSDCGPTLFQSRDDHGDPGPCVPIPDTMIAVFDQEAESIEAGQRVMKQLFTGIIYSGYKEAEAMFHFRNIAFLQREVYAKLCRALQEKVYDASSIGLQFAGGTGGSPASIKAIKKLCAGVIAQGKLPYGPLRNALGFISDLEGSKGEVVVTPLSTIAERIAFWLVSHLEIFYDVSSLLKRALIADFAKHASSSSKDDADCGKFLASVITKNAATLFSHKAITWHGNAAENHAVIKSVIADIVTLINLDKATPGLTEAIALITVMVENAVDHAANILFNKTRTLHDTKSTFNTEELLDSPHIAVNKPKAYKSCVAEKNGTAPPPPPSGRSASSLTSALPAGGGASGVTSRNAYEIPSAKYDRNALLQDRKSREEKALKAAAKLGGRRR